MKPQHEFIAERALAQHCPELVRAVPLPAELLPMLAHCGDALAKALGPLLAPLLGGEAPAVSAEAPQLTGSNALAEQIAPLAANSLMAAGADSAPLLVSIEAAAILRLVDRAFGGKGAVNGPLPELFPLSAELMIVRLEELACTALARAFGLAWPGAMRTVRRNASLGELSPFVPGTELAIQRFTIAEGGGASWAMTLALPLATLAALCGPSARLGPTSADQRAAVNPADEPYGALPLTLNAVLVDMAVPVSVLSALEPGQILPVSIARSVPLRIGTTTIAHGTIGALDERVAVQITQAF